MKQLLCRLADRNVVVGFGEPPDDVGDYQLAVKNYFVSSYMEFKINNTAEERAKTQRLRRNMEMMWDASFAIANGRLHLGNRSSLELFNTTLLHIV